MRRFVVFCLALFKLSNLPTYTRHPPTNHTPFSFSLTLLFSTLSLTHTMDSLHPPFLPIGLILVWSWSELRLFLKLRQEFLFRSASRYSSRVVLLQNLPEDLQTVESLKQLFATAPGGGVEHVYLVRDVSRLEKAVKQRQVVLDKLEETESKYMNAIARASAMVSFTTLNMRSRSWLGRCVDRVKTCFRLEGSSVGGSGGKNPDEEDYVGHLKLYQLGDVPKLSLADLSSPTAINSVPSASERRSSQTLQQQGTTLSNVSNSGGLAVLKWYQKPRRPRHYAGIPLLSKRQDSIRYYRGELCRLNKVIEQEYEQQAKTMADDRQGIPQPHAHRPQSRARNGLHPDARSAPGQPGSVNGNESVVILDDVATASETEKGASPTKSARPNQVDTLPAAFILMRTRAGAKAIASGTVGQDKIPVKSRTLGIPPRDIEWRVLGQATSRLSKLLRRAMIVSVGSLLVVGCGLVVSAIASMAVFKGWERVIEEEAEVLAGPAVYLRQGVLAPLLLALLMFAGSWILNGNVVSFGILIFCEHLFYLSLTLSLFAMSYEKRVVPVLGTRFKDADRFVDPEMLLLLPGKYF